MSGFQFDANILSELRKGRRCDPGVRRWVEVTPAEAMFVSVVVLGEIRRGVERIRLRDPKQARALEKWLHGIPAAFSDRILHVDERVADQWGRPRRAPTGTASRRIPGSDGPGSRTHRRYPGRRRLAQYWRSVAESVFPIPANGYLNGQCLDWISNGNGGP